MIQYYTDMYRPHKKGLQVEKYLCKSFRGHVIQVVKKFSFNGILNTSLC
jgi:hypothetical protein